MNQEESMAALNHQCVTYPSAFVDFLLKSCWSYGVVWQVFESIRGEKTFRTAMWGDTSEVYEYWKNNVKKTQTH